MKVLTWAQRRRGLSALVVAAILLFSFPAAAVAAPVLQISPTIRTVDLTDPDGHYLRTANAREVTIGVYFSPDPAVWTGIDLDSWEITLARFAFVGSFETGTFALPIGIDYFREYSDSASIPDSLLLHWTYLLFDTGTYRWDGELSATYVFSSLTQLDLDGLPLPILIPLYVPYQRSAGASYEFDIDVPPYDPASATVPEPTTFLLMGTVLAGVAARRSRAS